MAEIEGLLLTDDDDGVDWHQAKTDLATDRFDNGRSPAALQRSFEQSDHVVFAWLGGSLVGMARMLSDGVCNAYLVDVWTKSTQRRAGIGTAMVRDLLSRVPGQHVALQTDHAVDFYRALGFEQEGGYMFRVVGHWLDNAANN
jgi:ribosomal protein S18 acetylase RimI-like enzyme